DIHPVFKEMAKKAKAVYSLCDPALTDALEFTDGKLMFGKHKVLKEITWERCKEHMGGVKNIAAMIGNCNLFGMENWTMIPNMSSIWEGLIDEVFPLMETPDKKPLAFFDLADPEKRTKGDILRAMELIGNFSEKFRTVLGLNEKELYEITEVFGITTDAASNPEEKLRKAVLDTYGRLGIYCLAVHPTKEATCCLGGEFFRTAGPYCANPALTTGAGDNFNAGFCLGMALELDPLSALTLGVATSGFYVRNAKSPSYPQVIDFISKWDKGEITD
ncbi:MAG: carbohydrate kinase family protein, partial [Defluviitaleaceae bacterium]|nr:carbohydrate kinase family protein [Defluviitaleaceae bacterium]